MCGIWLRNSRWVRLWCCCLGCGGGEGGEERGTWRGKEEGGRVIKARHRSLPVVCRVCVCKGVDRCGRCCASGEGGREGGREGAAQKCKSKHTDKHPASTPSPCRALVLLLDLVFRKGRQAHNNQHTQRRVRQGRGAKVSCVLQKQGGGVPSHKQVHIGSEGGRSKSGRRD